MNTIVVGVDGSKGSLAALRFALDEAHVRGSDVKAVSAWHIPTGVYQVGYVPGPIEKKDYQEPAKAMLVRSLEEVAGNVDGVTVTPVVREGQAADVLTDEARGADLLVVGSRGLGGFRGLLLGSVSQQCAHHASCPVAIVRTPEK